MLRRLGNPHTHPFTRQGAAHEDDASAVPCYGLAAMGDAGRLDINELAHDSILSNLIRASRSW